MPERVEQIEVMQDVVVHGCRQLGSSAEAPNPGWWGTISRKRSASGSSGSNPNTVPPPWKKTTRLASPGAEHDRVDAVDVEMLFRELRHD